MSAPARTHTIVSADLVPWDSGTMGIAYGFDDGWWQCRPLALRETAAAGAGPHRRTRTSAALRAHGEPSARA
jgi:hypothetical protein